MDSHIERMIVKKQQRGGRSAETAVQTMVLTVVLTMVQTMVQNMVLAVVWTIMYGKFSAYPAIRFSCTLGDPLPSHW